MMMVQQEQATQQKQHTRTPTAATAAAATATTAPAPTTVPAGTTAAVTVNVNSDPQHHPQAHNSQQGPQTSSRRAAPATPATGSGRQPLLQQQQHTIRVAQPAGGAAGIRRQQQQQQQGVGQRQLQNQARAATVDEDPEQQDEDSTVRRRRQRPLYKRVYQYVRDAWLGVQSTLDSELEDLETPPRYRPDSLDALCKATRFTEAEIKRIYRGFKAECPTGVVREDTFKMIYAQFFPQGANTSQYAHYVFNTLDQDHSGLISFEDFVQNLSVLSRGSLDEKLRWAFTLYDINGDGCITKEEMTDIVSAIYELMGKLAEPCIEDDTIREKVDRIFQKMDRNGDGVVTLDEFLECCHTDEDISASMAVFDSAI